MKRIRRLGSFAGWAAISQLITLVAGVLVVRGLEKDQYALYTICLSSLGVVTVLSTSGVTSTLLALAGKGHREGRDLGPYFRAAFNLRSRIVLIVFVPVVIYTGVMLAGNGADPVQLGLMLFLLLVTILPTLTASFSRLPLQLYGEYRTIQWVTLGVAVLRLCLTGLVVVLAVRYGVAFLLVGALVAIADALLTGRHAAKRVRWTGDVVPEGTSDLMAALRRSLPGTLTVILAELFVTATLTWNGNTAAIATIGALGRFAVAFVVVNSIVSNIASPAIARISDSRASVARGLLFVTGIYAAISGTFVMATWVFADALLWVIGPQYAGLRLELVLVAAAGAITNFSLYGIGAVTYARGWNKLTWTYIPLIAVWATIGLVFLDLSTVVGGIIFSGSLALVRLANQIIRLLSGFSRLPPAGGK